MNVLSKITATLLAIAALALTFIGCSSSDEGGGNDDLPPLDNGSEVPDGISSSSSSSSSIVIEKIYGDDLVDQRNGRTYKTVVIGNQTWMAEDLVYCPPSTTFCYGYVNGNRGGFNNWNAALEACPSGWHLPDYDEWKELIDYVESENKCTDCAGKHLKSKEYINGNGKKEGLDTYGFTADLSNGAVSFMNGNEMSSPMESLVFWTASEIDADYAYYLTISYYGDGVIFRSGSTKESQLKVRCLKD